MTIHIGKCVSFAMQPLILFPIKEVVFMVEFENNELKPEISRNESGILGMGYRFP